jgi:coenzyme F420-reducing hydrogenase beta subunit
MSALDYASIETQLRARAAELLTSGEVACVVGWGAGRLANQTTPVFVTSPEDCDKLVYGEYCVNTLSKYAKWEAAQGKLAICVRGCDSRGINRLIADNQVKREDVYLLGLPCTGCLDRANGEMLFKCSQCAHRDPVVCDEMLGSAVAESEEEREARAAARFKGMEGLSKMPVAARKTFFDKAFDRCIRCYACREVCPCCTCRECFVEKHDVGWEGKQYSLAENRFWSLTRVFHIADRCIECCECERVCPMNLPLMMLNRRIIKDMDELFAMPDAGLDASETPVLNTFSTNDVEEFM